MAVQKYDIRRPLDEGGNFEERHWSPMNVPVLNSKGEPIYIIHRVEDVTELVKLSQVQDQQQQRSRALEAKTEFMETELNRRKDEIKRTNAELELIAQLLKSEQLSRAEAEINAKRLHLASSTNSTGVFDWDLHTHKIYWSPELEKLYGLKPDGFQGSFDSWRAALHPEDREYAAQAMLQTVEHRTDLSTEFRIVLPNGQVRWILACGQLEYASDGTPLRMVGLNTDITPQKISEDLLRRTEKLAASGRMAATIAHEINNPLEAITNLLYLAGNAKGPKLKHYLQLAGEELKRVSHITKKTLGFYRDACAPEEVNLATLVREVVPLYEKQRATKSVKLHTDLKDAPLYGLSGELKQVISNLLSNAIEAVSSAGEVQIRTYQDGVAHLLVSDDGPGIPNEIKNKIFDPFFTTNRDVGTGLGLWVSKEIIEKHGGNIDVQCADAGTKFIVKLAGLGARATGNAAS
jgi:PAS domain S-box-containing protein